MLSKTFVQTARQFWHRHDVGVNGLLTASAVAGAFAGYKLSEDANLGSPSANFALRAASTTLGAGFAPLTVAACVGYPPTALVPLGVGVCIGFAKSEENNMKEKQADKSTSAQR